jgi:hypothetical protein
MMEADIRNIALCPYGIVVYAAASRPDEVFVAYRRLINPGSGSESREALDEVEELLDNIAREAVGQK